MCKAKLQTPHYQWRPTQSACHSLKHKETHVPAYRSHKVVVVTRSILCAHFRAPLSVRKNTVTWQEHLTVLIQLRYIHQSDRKVLEVVGNLNTAVVGTSNKAVNTKGLKDRMFSMVTCDFIVRSVLSKQLQWLVKAWRTHSQQPSSMDVAVKSGLTCSSDSESHFHHDSATVLGLFVLDSWLTVFRFKLCTVWPFSS